MSAPDRPTREQIDAALARADLVHDGGTNEVRLIVHRLAAEVRALRAELDRVHLALHHETNAHVAERDRLRAALVARTPQPAETEPNRTHLEMTGTAAALTVWQTRVPGGTPHVAHRIDVDPRCLTLSWANGARPRATVEHATECRCDDFTGRLTKTLTAPLPAVPDGEDDRAGAVTLRPSALMEAFQTVETLLGYRIPFGFVSDLLIRCATHEHADAIRAAFAPLHAALDGEDVPARLDAAADAMKDDGMSGYWVATVRDLARRLRDCESAETRAAVAAALALPTETQK